MAACISSRNGNDARMKVIFGLLLISVAGCVSTGPIEIGMSERAWRKAADDENLVGKADSGETVWSAGDRFYHFRDGKLFRISGGVQQVQAYVE